ncbi:hypothetical protein F2Q69_00035190 [Brassica cretica]|uniref:Uncharacterized protein n=1 Tax=Brassica cretica TaxID=69181 RepID=A0A8S9SAE3_BRACR|nr:hypothetical protein F2Q69_00035190 [Brassica cretica]
MSDQSKIGDYSFVAIRGTLYFLNQMYHSCICRPDVATQDVLEHFGRAGRSKTHLGELVELNRIDTYLGELVQLNQSDTYLAEPDELNTQVSWTDTIMYELSWTNTHLDELNKLVRSSELVRPPEKQQMANLLSDGTTTNSIIPKERTQPRRPLERLTSRHREQSRPSRDDAVHDHRRDDQRSYHRSRKLDDRFSRNQQYDDCEKRLLPALQVVEESKRKSKYTSPSSRSEAVSKSPSYSKEKSAGPKPKTEPLSSLSQETRELKETPTEEAQKSSAPEKLLEQSASTEPRVIPQSISCQSRKHRKDHDLIVSPNHENVSIKKFLCENMSLLG